MSGGCRGRRARFNEAEARASESPSARGRGAPGLPGFNEAEARASESRICSSVPLRSLLCFNEAEARASESREKLSSELLLEGMLQ